MSSFEAISNGERPLLSGFGAPPCPGDTEDLEPDALPWREGRIGDREPRLVPGSLRGLGLLTGPVTISAPDSLAALVSS